MTWLPCRQTTWSHGFLAACMMARTDDLHARGTPESTAALGFWQQPAAAKCPAAGDTLPRGLSGEAVEHVKGKGYEGLVHGQKLKWN